MITYAIILTLTPGNWIAICALGVTILGGLIIVIFRAGGLSKDVKSVNSFIFKAGGLSKDVSNINTNVKDIQIDIKDLRERVPIIETNVKEILMKRIPKMENDISQLYQRKYTITGSPRYLNEFGKKILKDSGVNYFIEEHYDEIVRIVKENDITNAYKAEGIIIDVLKNYKNRDEYIRELESRAFKSGTDVSTLLFVAAIHIRDKIFRSLNLEVVDIDKDKPKKKRQ